jgi:ATP-dependent Clp protease protease subunit
MNQFWDIRAAGKEAEIDIFGVIGDIAFMEESTLATDFIRELKGLGKGVARLNINIYSEGGSVWDGLAMYQAIRDFPGEKVAHVSTLAASIATVIALGADRIEVGPEATWMIHDPIAMGVFTAESDYDHAKARWVAGKNKILNIYERRTGQKRDHLSDLMTAETWMYGEEIKKAGFADVVKKDQTKMRLAAGPLRLVNHWRNAPESVIKRKPQPLPPELEQKARRLGVIGG